MLQCSICKQKKPPTEFHGKKRKCGRCKDCQKEYQREYRRRERTELRRQILEHYSGTPPKCQCPGCEENRYPFLTLDHINDNGAEERKKFANRYALHRHIRKNNYPEGYRVLCYNCNCARSTDYCPVHEKPDHNEIIEEASKDFHGEVTQIELSPLAKKFIAGQMKKPK